MFSRIILEETIPLQRQAIVNNCRSTTWGEFRELTQISLKKYAAFRRRRIGLLFPPTAAGYSTLAALDRLQCDVFLFDSRLRSEEAVRFSEKLKLGALLCLTGDDDRVDCAVKELSDEDAWSGGPTITILTSGSTGEPKAARHSWESLSRPVRSASQDVAPRWLLSYRPHLYAGLQVMLQCFSDRGTLVAPDQEIDPRHMARFMCETSVQFASATPSYWRRLLLFAEKDVLNRIPLLQITLGGEVIDQPLLDNLRRHFPRARLVHIYATTELGRCFSVSDGIAGFPTSYLNRVLPDGTELKVQDGELLVRSLNSMKMYDPHSAQQGTVSDWASTGDLVELKEDRVYFVGRRTDMINVAGSKVFPMEVERVIRVIPGISDVRVFGKASSIAGELVACEIVPSPGQDCEKLKEEIIRACRNKLASPQQPRLITFVNRIDLSAAGKTLRNRTP
jgi:acyl-CoA synthetase (AMP-forming)/AMP-acid ligase II